MAQDQLVLQVCVWRGWCGGVGVCVYVEGVVVWECVCVWRGWWGGVGWGVSVRAYVRACVCSLMAKLEVQQLMCLLYKCAVLVCMYVCM